MRRRELQSKEGCLAIAQRITEHLNKGGLNRKVLVRRPPHNLSDSVVNKVFQGHISERTLTAVELILDTSFSADSDDQPQLESGRTASERSAQDARSNGPRDFGYVLRQLDLNPGRIADSDALSGKYLLFSYIGSDFFSGAHSDKIAVTWVELRKSTSQSPFPFFTARRPGSGGQQMIFEGLYYEYMKSLFMFGHIAKTSFSRSLSLIPMGPGYHRHDRHGIIAGASFFESLFVSNCFLKWIGDEVPWRQYRDVLGERQESELASYSDLLDFMRERRNLTASIARMSG